MLQEDFLDGWMNDDRLEMSLSKLVNILVNSQAETLVTSKDDSL